MYGDARVGDRSGAFIGHHLVKFLVNKGYWVRGPDIKYPEYELSPGHEFELSDLRRFDNCLIATRDIDEMCRLAADMGEWDASWSLPPKSSPQYAPHYEGVKEGTRFYLRYRDDPWTTKSDPGFEEVYDVGADPYQVRNLAYSGEASQATLDRLQDRLRGFRAYSCRAAENGG
jgi:hypothetical protein